MKNLVVAGIFIFAASSVFAAEWSDPSVRTEIYVDSAYLNVGDGAMPFKSGVSLYWNWNFGLSTSDYQVGAEGYCFTRVGRDFRLPTLKEIQEYAAQPGNKLHLAPSYVSYWTGDRDPANHRHQLV